MATITKDKFANVAIVTATESAANTLTFVKLEMGTSLFDRVAMIIHRVEWYFQDAVGLLVGDGDRINMSITNTNTLTSIGADQEGVLVRQMLRRTNAGTPATVIMTEDPTVNDFTTLPGDGVIMLPSPLYVGIQGASLASAATVYARILFTFMEMKNEDYFELMQARQTLISS